MLLAGGGGLKSPRYLTGPQMCAANFDKTIYGATTLTTSLVSSHALLSSAQISWIDHLHRIAWKKHLAIQALKAWNYLPAHVIEASSTKFQEVKN